MAMFEARVKKLKFTYSPFGADQMMIIGQATLDSIVKRIQAVKDVTDAPAKPLTEKYKQEKVAGRYVALGGMKKYDGQPYRDWTLRGRTLQSLKVKTASEERVTIGPTTDETTKIVLARNKWDHMWGISPSDMQVLYAAVRQQLQRRSVVRIDKVA